MICETQARMLLQVEEKNVEEAIMVIQSKGGVAAVIGEITSDDKEIFHYRGRTVAVIPNKPSKAILKELRKEG